MKNSKNINRQATVFMVAIITIAAIGLTTMVVMFGANPIGLIV